MRWSARLLLLLALGCAAACARPAAARTAVPGDPQAGHDAIARYGCGACHTIPGVVGANGRVGPTLADEVSRPLVAGRVPMGPNALAGWIQHPQRIAPGVDMPEMGVTDDDARDIAAYLYSLQ